MKVERKNDKMKKLKLFIVFVMCFTVLVVHPKALEKDTFYVKTDVTKEYDDYVHSVFEKLLMAQDNISNYDNIFLGTGIKVFLPEETYNYYVYPVFFGDEIKATIHITKDENDFGVTYTEMFAQQLNYIKNNTSIENPLILVRQNGYVYCQVKETRILVDYREFNTNQKSKEIYKLESLPNINTSSIPTINIYDNMIYNNVKGISTERASVNKLSWIVFETQGNQPWCASITATNIVRNRGKYMSSAHMRSWLGITNRGLTNEEVVRYLKNYMNYSQVMYTTSGSLTKSQVISQIDNRCAVFAHFRNTNEGHAIAIIGYNTIADAYHIHNPWYSYTETVGVGGTYASGTYNYKWTGGSIYNIQ